MGLVSSAFPRAGKPLQCHGLCALRRSKHRQVRGASGAFLFVLPIKASRIKTWPASAKALTVPNMTSTFDPATEIGIFLHIPKCAGTSINYALREAFGEQHFAHAKGPKQGLDKELYHDDVLFASGHRPFGSNIFYRLDRKPVIMTVLRDPWQRFKSYFHYVRRKKSHALHKKHEGLSEMSPAAFVEAINYRAEMSNQQTQYICGSKSNPQLDRAKENLEKKIQFFCPVEDLEEMLPRFKSYFQIEFELPHLNTTQYRPTDPDLESLKEDVMAANAMDVELMAFARDHWRALTA